MTTCAAPPSQVALIPWCLRLSGAAVLTVVLSACTTPAPRLPSAVSVIVPPAWQPSAALVPGPRDPTALVAWWTRFGDPVLTELITSALRSSPDVRTAFSRIAESRARRGVARAPLFPSLSANVSGGGSRTRDHTTDLTSSRESYTAGLDASWQVDLFGLQRQTLAAASADLAQTAENFYGVQVSLAAEVASAYVTLRSAEAQLAIVQRSLGTRHETVQLTQWREQAGTGDGLDTQQALSALEQARVSIPVLQLTVAQTRHQLALLAGRTPGALDPLLAAPRAIPTPPADFALGLPAETLRQRPDVRAAEQGVIAATARSFAARRQRWPTFTLTGSLGVTAQHPDRLFSPDSTVASLLGGLTAPIFSAGRISQNIAIQTEQERQALIAYESTVLTALAEVEDALAAAQHHAERATIFVRAVTAAAASARFSALRYEAGQVDLFVSLDAQRTLLALEQQQIVTAADRATASIRLYQTLGGGWSLAEFPASPP